MHAIIVAAAAPADIIPLSIFIVKQHGFHLKYYIIITSLFDWRSGKRPRTALLTAATQGVAELLQRPCSCSESATYCVWTTLKSNGVKAWWSRLHCFCWCRVGDVSISRPALQSTHQDRHVDHLSRYNQYQQTLNCSQKPLSISTKIAAQQCLPGYSNTIYRISIDKTPTIGNSGTQALRCW